MGGQGAQSRQCLTGAIGERDGGVLGEGQDPSLGDLRLKMESVSDRRRNEYGRGRGERQTRSFERHFTAAAFNHENLEQIAMSVCANGPVVDRRPGRDRLDMNKIERLVVRRIAVEVEERERRGHGESISQPQAGRSGSLKRPKALHKKAVARRLGGPLRLSLIALASAANLLAALAGLVLATVLAALTALTALMLLTRPVLRALSALAALL
jgi:hypothetical protein